jgi:hypothetical protein
LRRHSILAAAALLLVAALHFASVPRTIWEFDESWFAAAVERYEPLLHHPPPPGYPLYIGFAKLLPGTPFSALLVTSMLAVVAGLGCFFVAFRELAGAKTAVIATMLLYASPALLVSGTLPQSDAGAMALFGLAIWACARMLPVAGGRLPPQGAAEGTGNWQLATAALACAATIGWRLQMSIAVVPMFLAAVLLLKTWRERFAAVAAFGVACLAWFVPLVVEAGGPESYWKWLSGQAAYYAQHDADLSRSGHSASHIALRFVAHPWGPKWLALPVLLLAVLGAFFVLVERRPLRPPTDRDKPGGRSGRRSTGPLAVGCLVYLAFALATMDPADAVRYAIPSLPLIALLAGTALARVPVAVLLYVAGAYWYAMPVLQTRARTPAPPTAAARWIQANVPRDTLVLFDMPLAPHASWLLRDYRSMRIDAGLARHGGDPAVAMVIYADGERGEAKGVTFRWPDTDAYRKLTRQHYGAVSVIPLPVEQRFRVVEGVYAPERRRDGRSWRWIGARGVIELPDRGATHVRVRLRTPPEYPLDRNRVRVNGVDVEIGHGKSVEVVVPFARRLTFLPERTFVPARIPGANNRDARTLSVMLTSVEQLGGRPAGE